MKTAQENGISEVQVREFQDTGVLAIEHFFSARETAALQADVRRLRDGGFLRNIHTLGDGKTHADTAQNLQLCPAGYCSALVRALPFCPRVVDAVQALIGAEIAHHLDQIFLKPARIGKGTGWHQDNAYFKIRDPLKGTAMWIAVDDATAENGTLRLAPGRFREEIEHTRDPQSDHHIHCHIEETEAITVALPAGGVVFFCYGTPHATGDNTTDRDRAGLAYHFINADYAPKGFFTTGRGRNHTHPYLTGPRASNGRKEYGEPMRQAWERAVALGADPADGSG